MRRAAFGFFWILGTTAAVLGLLGGFGVRDIAIFSIVAGGIFYATMQLIDRPPT